MIEKVIYVKRNRKKVSTTNTYTQTARRILRRGERERETDGEASKDNGPLLIRELGYTEEVQTIEVKMPPLFFNNRITFL